MALLQRTRILANERIDLPDYNNIEDFVCADFKAIHKNVWSSENFVMSGFEATGTGTDTLSVVLAGSEAIFGKDDGTLYVGAPSLSPLTTNNLVPSATNFVEVFIDQDTGGADSRAFWDQTAAGGNGAEFSQIIDTFSFIKPVYVINTSNFSGDPDKLALCEVDVNGSGIITEIRDARNMFWRLGRFGNTTFDFSWNSRVEPANTQFTGADKDIKNFKDWADAMMSAVKEIKGSTYWYEVAAVTVPGSFRVAALSLVTPLTTGAKVFWNGSVLAITDSSGAPSSTDNIAAVRFFDSALNLRLRRQDGTGGSTTISIADGEVLWVKLPEPLAAQDYSGVGVLASNYQVTARGSVPLDDSTFWLAYREGSRLFFRGTGELQTGESSEIGDNVPQTLLDNLGLVNETTAASYSSNIRGVASQSLVARLGVLTDAEGDEQEDRSAYFRSDAPVTWTGTQLQFTTDIVLEILNTKSGTLTQHTILAANSPLTLANGESLYVAINRLSASENVVPVNSGVTPIPAQTQANKDIIVLARRVDALSAPYLHIPFHKQVLEPGQTVRLGASGSSAADSGNGDELIVLAYKASFRDDFNTTPIASGPINIGAGFTDSTLYSAALKYFRLNYDATKTVTGTGTSMTLSGAPTFTVKVGDILRVGSEARRITAIPTQTTPTIESAFTTNPTAAGCTVSQAVYTTDLNNFVGDGQAISGLFSDSIASALTTYDDTETLGDIIFDNGATPNVAYTASADGTNYSVVSVRPNGVNNENDAVSLPVAGSNLFLRFFSNKTSGSGAVNLLGYKTFFHREDTQDDGFTLQQAYCFTDGIGTEVNCSTPIVVGGKTHLALAFTFVTGLNPGEPNGQLEVYLDGKKIPRFIDSTLTPDASYTEVGNNAIELNTDYSLSNLSLEVIKPIAAQDVSEDNSDDIFDLQTHKFKNYVINGNMDFWQRNTTFNNVAQSTYVADRWVSYNGTTATVNVTRQTISSLGIGSQFCLRSERSAGTAEWIVESNFEGADLVLMKGKYMTFSLLLRKGSALTSNVTIFLQTTSTEARGGSAVESASLVIPNASLSTTDFQRFSVTLFVPANTAAAGVRVYVSANQLGAANAYFEMTQVMLNEGRSVAPFTTSGNSKTEELLACQRYYEKSYDQGTFPATVTNNSRRLISVGTGAGGGCIYFKVVKRTSSPTMVFYSPSTGAANNVRNATNNTDQAASTNISGDSSSEVAVTGILAGEAFVVHFTADAEL